MYILTLWESFIDIWIELGIQIINDLMGSNLSCLLFPCLCYRDPYHERRKAFISDENKKTRQNYLLLINMSIARHLLVSRSIILNGNSEKVDKWNQQSYMFKAFVFIESSRKSEISSKKSIYFCFRAQRVLSYHLI